MSGTSSTLHSARSRPDALLLRRLEDLHARLRPGQFPVGADRAGRVHTRARYWMSGFWPGALWHAAALAGRERRVFARWALSATLANLGRERTDTHDVGFMYGESSLAAWRALCSRGSRSALCAGLRRSVLTAARELLALAAGNRAAGTIPVTSRGRRSQTIIDSMMNIAILPWASRVTGDRAFARAASRHAHLVARLLVRPDGGTAQSIHFDRRTGRVLSIGSNQGLSSTSTWSRGEGWALYGFAQSAADLHERGLLEVAERIAGYVERHLPRGGVPSWDYDAPPGAPVDVSAGVITADGLFHLTAACQGFRGGCPGADRWVALGRQMLAATLRYVRSSPPLGLLAGQELNEHFARCWCNGGELIFGLTYALEGLRLERGV